MPRNQFPIAFYYFGIALWIVVLVVGAYFWGAHITAYAIGVTLLALAAMRAFLPAGTIPVIRSRKVDVATFLILAVAVLGLASWGAVPAVS